MNPKKGAPRPFITKSNVFRVAFARSMKDPWFLRFSQRGGNAGAIHLDFKGLGFYDPHTWGMQVFRGPDEGKVSVRGNIIEYTKVLPGMTVRFSVTETGLTKEILLERRFLSNIADPSMVGLSLDSYLVFVFDVERIGAQNLRHPETGHRLFLTSDGLVQFYFEHPEGRTYSGRELELVEGDIGDTLVYGLKWSKMQYLSYPLVIDPTIRTVDGKTTADYIENTNNYDLTISQVDGAIAQIDGVGKNNTLNGSTASVYIHTGQSTAVW